MLPELGHFGLILALVLAFISATIPLYGAWRDNPRLLALSRSLSFGQFIFVGFAFLTLVIAFVTNDFTVRYVAENSNRALPLFYRVCAVWGAHEGSLLLWVTVLNAWIAAVALFSRSLPMKTVARVLSVMAMINMGFLSFLLFTSDPFLRLLPFAARVGRDLNPILQDPGLAMHPPTLYMGYVGFSVAFAFAMAALMGGELDARWARWARPWTIAAWCFLTCGITMGSWWSYRQLGWGGWWFWDPVENASFLPWLVGTGLMHSLAVTEKRNTFKAWTVLLALSAFSLSLLGTFLVRSGVLTSVHAFANDPARGGFLIKFIVIVVGVSLFMYALRAPVLTSEGRFELLSRETFLLLNNVLFFVAMITVLMGTLYPLIIQLLGMGKISVGPPYFDSVFVPLMIPVIFLAGLGPHCQWKSDKVVSLFHRVRWVLVLSFALMVLIPLVAVKTFSLVLAVTLFLVSWLVLTMLYDLYAKAKLRGGYRALNAGYYAMVLAHLGLAVCALGIIVSSSYSTEKNVKMHLGDSVNVGQYTFTLKSIVPLKGPNYTGVTANVLVTKAGEFIANLGAQKRNFTRDRYTKTQAAIHVSPFRDLYVSLGNPIGTAWGMRIYNKPLIRFIWAGGFLMLFGGLLSLLDRRYRLISNTQEY